MKSSKTVWKGGPPCAGEEESKNENVHDAQPTAHPTVLQLLLPLPDRADSYPVLYSRASLPRDSSKMTPNIYTTALCNFNIEDVILFDPLSHAVEMRDLPCFHR